MATIAQRLLSVPLPTLVDNAPQSITLMMIIGMLPIPMTFPVNPESLTGLSRYLMNITPTMGGGWVDDFGRAPSPITLNGTFGYNTKGIISDKVYKGFGWSKYLEWIVEQSHTPDNEGEMPEVWLLSWISQHFYRVTLDEINIQQNVGRNNIWIYNLKITALESVVAVKGLLDFLSSSLLGDISTPAIENIAKIEIAVCTE